MMPQKTNDYRIIFGSKGEYECDYTTGKAYVKGGKMRLDLTLGATQDVHAVFKDGYTYRWVPHFLGVQKEKIEPDVDVSDLANKAMLTSQQDQKNNDACKWSTIPDSLFDIPTDESLDLPIRKSNKKYDQLADQLFSSKWSSQEDPKRGYSFDFPISAKFSTSSWPHLDNYEMFGSVFVDDYSEFHFSTNALHKKLTKPLEASFAVSTTTLEHEYQQSVEIEKSIPDLKLLKVDVIQLGNTKDARLRSTYNEKGEGYQTKYFFENEDYVFTLFINGPSEKVNALAEKFIRSFRKK